MNNGDLHLKKIKQKARVRKQTKKKRVSLKSGTLSQQKKMAELQGKRKRKPKVKVKLKRK